RVQLSVLSGRGNGVESRCRSEAQRQRPAYVAAGRRRVLQRSGEATGMRKSHRSGGSNVDQRSHEALPGQDPEAKGCKGVGDPACRGGLRLRGRDPEVEAHVEGGLGGCDVQRVFRKWFATGGGFRPARWALPFFGPRGRSGSRRSNLCRQESTGVFTTPYRSNGR